MTGEQKFDIREKIKYGKEWDLQATKDWMAKTRDSCIDDFRKVSEDYKTYKKSDFATLEESIAINNFGISEDFSKRAYKGLSLLRYFTKDQRELATRARQKMEEISGKDFIEMQIVPIAARMDDDIQKDVEKSKADGKKSGTDKEPLKDEPNDNTGKIFVFRVKDSNGNPVWLDCQLRQYTSWDDYLTGNKSPQCIMCYPKDGFLRKKKEINGKIYYVENDVQFGEPPSCTLGSRIKSSFDTVIVYVSPVIAIGTFWCPASWAMTAAALSWASTGLLLYSLGTQGYQIYDQINHGEDYGAALMTFITSIGTIIVSKGLNRYLRGVLVQRRALTTLESVVITGFLLGLAGSQVASFAWMTWNLATKPKLEPMDIVSYSVACHNLYSCVVSPWTAEKLLTKVQAEVRRELQEVARNAGLEEMRNAGYGERVAEIEETINAGAATKEDFKETILQTQQEFLDEKGQNMEHDGARGAYSDFVTEAQNDRGRNTSIDQNGRIIKTVTYMDAEMVFKMVSITGSKIQFANGETMDLLVNSQLEVHPRALNQMNRISREGNEITDIQRMMELTKAYTDSTQEGFRGDRQTAEADYLRDIRPCLKDYQMITRREITKVKESIDRQTDNEALRRRFDNMAPKEAYRMRTVLLGAPDKCLDLVEKMAKAYDPNNPPSVQRIAAFVEILKLEIEDFPEQPDTREQRRLYHQELRQWEEAGLRNAGRTEDEARRIAEDNYNKVLAHLIGKRETTANAREDLRNGRLTGEEVGEIARVNKIERYYIQFQQYNYDEWNNGTLAYYRSLENQADFNTKMTNLRADIDRIATIARTQNLTMPDAVAAYYHVRKHHIPEDQTERSYLTTQKDHIFQAGHQKNTFISQDASCTSTVYRDGRGYFGVTKCPYDAELGRESGQPIVATHFWKDRGAAPAPAAAPASAAPAPQNAQPQA